MQFTYDTCWVSCVVFGYEVGIYLTCNKEKTPSDEKMKQYHNDNYWSIAWLKLFDELSNGMFYIYNAIDIYCVKVWVTN